MCWVCGGTARIVSPLIKASAGRPAGRRPLYCRHRKTGLFSASAAFIQPGVRDAVEEGFFILCARQETPPSSLVS